MSPIEFPAKIQLVEKRETRTSRGMLSKGWYQVDDQLVMVKGNSITEAGTAGYEPYSEVMASLIAQVLGLPHVEYVLMPAKLFPDIQTYSCDVVSVCPKFTTDDENSCIILPTWQMPISSPMGRHLRRKHCSSMRQSCTVRSGSIRCWRSMPLSAMKTATRIILM